MERYQTKVMRPSLMRVMGGCPLHPISRNSKRAARRSILYYCDLKSLLALRLVSKAVGEWTSREESRYFRDIRITLNLAEDCSITLADWRALQKIGHLCQRVIFTFVSKRGERGIEFSRYSEKRPTLNPLPDERLFSSHKNLSLVDFQAPILPGIFKEFGVNKDQPCGLFKRVLDLTPNMETLCIRDGAVWEEAMEEDWGRTLVDEALIYLRCQLEESLLSRAEKLDRVRDFHRLEKVRRVREVSKLETIGALEQLTQLEEWVVTQFRGLSRLDLPAKSEMLARIKGIAKENKLTRLDQLFRLEESLMAQRDEVARLTKQAQLPKLLEMQVGSPLGLWHFRTCLGYGNGGGSLLGTGTWGTTKTLNITLPTVTPGGTPGRRRTVKKGVYGFLAEFANTVETLGIGLATAGSKSPERVNPLVYDLDPEFGGGGEAAIYSALRRLVLKNMFLGWEGSLKELFTKRAPSCVDLVLVGCTFESDQACKDLYEMFELQNPQRLRNPNVPFVLARKLALRPGDRA